MSNRHVVPKVAGCGKGAQGPLAIDASTWKGQDFFVTSPLDLDEFVVSEAGRQFLEREVGEWLEFRPAITVPTIANSPVALIEPISGCEEDGAEVSGESPWHLDNLPGNVSDVFRRIRLSGKRRGRTGRDPASDLGGDETTE